MADNIVLMAKAFRRQFILPEFDDFCQHIDELYWNAKPLTTGAVSTAHTYLSPCTRLQYTHTHLEYVHTVASHNYLEYMHTVASHNYLEYIHTVTVRPHTSGVHAHIYSTPTHIWSTLHSYSTPTHIWSTCTQLQYTTHLEYMHTVTEHPHTSGVHAHSCLP